MKMMSVLVLALAASVSLTGCGDDEPMSDAQFLRKQQEQQLAADREAQRLQNDMAREQLRTQQIQNQALQAGLNPQYGQPVGTAAMPAQQVVHQDDGIGLGTVVAGAAAAGAVGYVAGKNNSTTNKSYYSQPKTYQQTTQRPVAKPVIKKPVAVAQRPATTYRPAPVKRSTPTVKRYSSSKRR